MRLSLILRDMRSILYRGHRDVPLSSKTEYEINCPIIDLAKGATVLALKSGRMLRAANASAQGGGVWF